VRRALPVEIDPPTLISILRYERNKLELYKIPKDFYSSLSREVRALSMKFHEEYSRRGISREAQSIQNDFHRIVDAAQEIYTKREWKMGKFAIFNRANDNARPKNMTAEEERFYVEMVEMLNSHYTKILGIERKSQLADFIKDVEGTDRDEAPISVQEPTDRDTQLHEYTAEPTVVEATPVEVAPVGDLQCIKIIRDVFPFAWKGGKKHAYKKEDVAYVTVELANFLMKNKAAVKN